MSFKARFRDIPEPIVIKEDVPESVISHENNDTGMENDLFLKLSDKIFSVPVWFEYTDDEKLAIIGSFIDAYASDNKISLSFEEKENCSKMLLAKLYGLGAIDSLLSNDEVRYLYIKGEEIYYLDDTENLLKTKPLFVDIEKLCSRLLIAAGVASDRPVLKFSYRNLLITMVRPPVGQYYLLIKKKSREKTDFAYLLENNKIDENIYAFFEYLLNAKKNILLSGAFDSGKTSYINSILEFVSNAVLFQNAKVLDVPSYICETLSEPEFENLINAVSFSKPDYILFDLNKGYAFENFDGGSVSTIRAESVFDAVTKISADEMCHRKITEKQAKAYVAKSFDYIVQLDQDLVIRSVSEFSLNKAGSLVLKEILTYEDGRYSYDFSDLDIQNKDASTELPDENLPTVELDGSFKSRFHN